MSQFNKEFFGRKTPSHDELVSMAIDNIDGIIHRIFPKILKKQNKNSVVNVFLCPRNERPPWCTSDFQTAFRTDPVCLEATKRYQGSVVDWFSSNGELSLPGIFRLCPETTWARYESTPEDICAKLNEVCEPVEIEKSFLFFPWGEICVKSNLDGKYIHSVLPYYERMIRFTNPFLESYQVDWEPEVICKRKDTDFILGYADVAFDFMLEIGRETIINDSETWRERKEDFKLRLIAEGKPKPNSWGAPHRQLKTYMDYLKEPREQNRLPIAGIILTFSKAPPGIHKILEKDNIYIIRFTKRGDISDGVSPEQTRL